MKTGASNRTDVVELKSLPMKKSFVRYRYLPSVCIEMSTLLPGATQCSVRERGVDQVNLMLFAEGVVSIFSMRPEPGDETAEALARIVTRHALRHTEAGVDLIADIKAQAADPCQELAWNDISVKVSAPRSAGKVTCYPLSMSNTAALVLATDDSIMPISFVAVTDPRAPRELFIAIGRTLLGHHCCLLNK